MSTVTARINVAAAHKAVGLGRPEENIAKELRVNGIPAVVTRHGIAVNEGTLDVREEDGLRVFEWTPPEKAPVAETTRGASEATDYTEPETVDISKPRKRR